MNLRRWLLPVALIGFTVRAVVPLGFMPAPLDQGGPFVPCHGTAAGAMLLSLAHHASHNEPTRGHQHHRSPDHTDHLSHSRQDPSGEPTGAHEAWEHCPLGAAAAHAALAQELVFNIAQYAHGFERPEPTTSTYAPRARSYLARAPPTRSTSTS